MNLSNESQYPLETLVINDYEEELKTRPKTVAIVGMGQTCMDFTSMMQYYEKCDGWPDEVWAINMAGNWAKCDKIFLMDGLAGYTNDWAQWMKKNIHVPIIMPFKEEGHENIIQYPLREVIEATGETWFGNTVSYAIAYAAVTGVEQLMLFGVDFSYILDRENGSRALALETGHASVAYWLGICHKYNMSVILPPETTLLDFKDRKFYGYPDDKQPVIQKITKEELDEQRKNVQKDRDLLQREPNQPVEEDSGDGRG